MTDDQPRRIQRSREKGWCQPAGAVYVGRPTRWGNPYQATRTARPGCWEVTDDGVTIETADSRTEAVERAVALYREFLRYRPQEVIAIREQLAGRDLACWCALGAPCHADILLEIANERAVSTDQPTSTLAVAPPAVDHEQVDLGGRFVTTGDEQFTVVEEQWLLEPSPAARRAVEDLVRQARARPRGAGWQTPEDGSEAGAPTGPESGSTLG